MFRLSGLPQIDAAEEKRRVRENVKSNVFSFVLLCAAIRLGDYLDNDLVFWIFVCTNTHTHLLFCFEVIIIYTVHKSQTTFSWCHLLRCSSNSEFGLFVQRSIIYLPMKSFAHLLYRKIDVFFILFSSCHSSICFIKNWSATTVITWADQRRTDLTI